MAALTPAPKFYEHDQNGNPLVGGKVYTYLTATSTPLATYTTAAGNVSNTNPVILDSSGRANIWLSPSSLYRFEVYDANDVLVWGPVDAIGAQLNTVALSASSGSSLIGFIQAGTGAVARTVQDKLREVQVSIFDFMTAEQKADVQAGTRLVDCTDALQRAVDYLHPRNPDTSGAYQGGIIDFPNGSYLMNGPVVYLEKHITLRGKLYGWLGAAESVYYGAQIVSNMVGPIIRMYAACTLEALDFIATVAPNGVTVSGGFVDLYDLSNWVKQCRFNTKATGIKIIGLPVAGKTGLALVEANMFFNQMEEANAAAIVFDGTNAGFTTMTVRDNMFNVHTQDGYTGKYAIRQLGAGALENVLIYGNNFQNYNSEDSFGLDIKATACMIFGNTFAGFAPNTGTAVPISLRSGTKNTVIGNYIFGSAQGIKLDGIDFSRLGINHFSGVAGDWYTIDSGSAGNIIEEPDSAAVIADGNPGANLIVGKNCYMTLTTQNFGSFTIGAAASATVLNANVTTISTIHIMPINASAATLMSGSKSLYEDIANRVAGTSFVVKTADGTNAAGTEQFRYVIFS